MEWGALMQLSAAFETKENVSENCQQIMNPCTSIYFNIITYTPTHFYKLLHTFLVQTQSTGCEQVDSNQPTVTGSICYPSHCGRILLTEVWAGARLFVYCLLTSTTYNLVHWAIPSDYKLRGATAIDIVRLCWWHCTLEDCLYHGLPVVLHSLQHMKSALLYRGTFSKAFVCWFLHDNNVAEP